MHGPLRRLGGSGAVRSGSRPGRASGHVAAARRTGPVRHRAGDRERHVPRFGGGRDPRRVRRCRPRRRLRGRARCGHRGSAGRRGAADPPGRRPRRGGPVRGRPEQRPDLPDGPAGRRRGRRRAGARRPSGRRSGAPARRTGPVRDRRRRAPLRRGLLRWRNDPGRTSDRRPGQRPQPRGRGQRRPDGLQAGVPAAPHRTGPAPAGHPGRPPPG